MHGTGVTKSPPCRTALKGGSQKGRGNGIKLIFTRMPHWYWDWMWDVIVDLQSAYTNDSCWPGNRHSLSELVHLHTAIASPHFPLYEACMHESPAKTVANRKVYQGRHSMQQHCKGNPSNPGYHQTGRPLPRDALPGTEISSKQPGQLRSDTLWQLSVTCNVHSLSTHAHTIPCGRAIWTDIVNISHFLNPQPHKLTPEDSGLHQFPTDNTAV